MRARASACARDYLTLRVPRCRARGNGCRRRRATQATMKLEAAALAQQPLALPAPVAAPALQVIPVAALAPQAMAAMAAPPTGALCQRPAPVASLALQAMAALAVPVAALAPRAMAAMVAPPTGVLGQRPAPAVVEQAAEALPQALQLQAAAARLAAARLLTSLRRAAARSRARPSLCTALLACRPTAARRLAMEARRTPLYNAFASFIMNAVHRSAYCFKKRMSAHGLL
jgi:hypothetical protein